MGNMTEEDIQQAGREYYGAGGAGEGQFYQDQPASKAYQASIAAGRSEAEARQAAAFAKADANKQYTDTNGNYQYGKRPENWYYDNTNEMMQEGINPYVPSGDLGGLSLGGAPDGDFSAFIPLAEDDNDGLSLGGPPSASSDPLTPDSGNNQPQSSSGVNIRPWHGTLGQKDTSWDWDAFAPKPQGANAWGGYDQDYQAFERYQPGMDSPWGMPDTNGGNKAFYQQQFANQLRDEQGYQSRERAAQDRRQDAIDNPFEATPTDWSWANNGTGLGETVISSGTPEDNRVWGLNEGFDTDMTNADVLRKASMWEQWSGDDKKRFNNWLTPVEREDGTEDSLFTDTNWANAGDPQKLINKLGAGDDPITGANRNWLTKVFSGMYGKQGNLAPSVPVGYAETLASYAEAGEG